MDPYIQLVQNYFAWKGWPAELNGEGTLIRLKYTLEAAGSWELFARTDPEHRMLLFFSVLPQKADADKRPLVAEFITRTNFGMSIGNFEMDWADGEIRYRTGFAFGDDGPDFEEIDRLVMANLVAVEDNYTVLQQVMRGELSPTAAVEKVRSEEGPDFTFRS